LFQINQKTLGHFILIKLDKSVRSFLSSRVQHAIKSKLFFI